MTKEGKGIQLILISPPDEVADEIDTLRVMFEAGLEHYHLRKPDWDDDQLRSYLDQLPQWTHRHIVVHKSPAIAKTYGLAGVHLNVHDDSSLPSSLPVSYSAHTLDEAAGVMDYAAYVFISPVFDSISKPGYKARIRMDEIKVWMDSHPEHRDKLVALGGIYEENLPQCKAAGFNYAAVLGAVWFAREGSGRVEKWQQLNALAAV